MSFHSWLPSRPIRTTRAGVRPAPATPLAASRYASGPPSKSGRPPHSHFNLGRSVAPLDQSPPQAVPAFVAVSRDFTIHGSPTSSP